MIEKIVKLQKSCAKRQEKVDFLEEHVEQLLSEVKKKNRIIQEYSSLADTFNNEIELVNSFYTYFLFS